MNVTDEMVEAALLAWYGNEHHAKISREAFSDMRAALAAAPAAAPRTPEERASDKAQMEAVSLTGLGLAAAPQEPVAFDALLREAEDEVRAKPTWKRYIDGTPLANDVPVWMAVFAQHHARQAAAPQWIACDQSLPEPGVEVLVRVDGKRGAAWSNSYMLVAFLSVYWETWRQERHLDAPPLVGVTHWMPLPAAPRREG